MIDSGGAIVQDVEGHPSSLSKPMRTGARTRAYPAPPAHFVGRSRPIPIFLPSLPLLAQMDPRKIVRRSVQVDNRNKRTGWQGQSSHADALEVIYVGGKQYRSGRNALKLTKRSLTAAPRIAGVSWDIPNEIRAEPRTVLNRSRGEGRSEGFVQSA